MPYDPEFGLFIQDEDGALWRGFFADLDEAKRTAQKLPTRSRWKSCTSASFPALLAAAIVGKNSTDCSTAVDRPAR